MCKKSWYQNSAAAAMVTRNAGARRDSSELNSVDLATGLAYTLSGTPHTYSLIAISFSALLNTVILSTIAHVLKPFSEFVTYQTKGVLILKATYRTYTVHDIA